MRLLEQWASEQWKTLQKGWRLSVPDQTNLIWHFVQFVQVTEKLCSYFAGRQFEPSFNTQEETIQAIKCGDDDVIVGMMMMMQEKYSLVA